ncbi:hypothetical protein SXCC_03975 [Gluconacetobacter sp. SXCC-1]|nr:hypothetical protein SXCC_03975 [Gluconacetobacter sp. SXCC-1]
MAPIPITDPHARRSGRPALTVHDDRNGRPPMRWRRCLNTAVFV